MAIRIVIFLVVGGAIAIGSLIFRDSISGGAGELKVGDCFDSPSGSESIAEVQHHPCKEAHNAELVGLVTYPGKASDPYPSEARLQDFADTQCAIAFRSYTGRDPNTDTLLSYGGMYPVLEGWNHGIHFVNCYLQRLDQGPMTRSYRTGTT